MVAVAPDDVFEDTPIETDEAPEEEVHAAPVVAVKATLRLPRPASAPPPPGLRRRDALELAMRRLDRGAPHRGALAAILGAIVRALPPRPVGRADPVETEVLRALDVVDDLLDDDVPFPDPALYPTFLAWRAMLLARVDTCPLPAVHEAWADARRRNAAAAQALDDAYAEHHLRAGRWNEALAVWGDEAERDGTDSVRRWRYALAAVAAADHERAAGALLRLGVPVLAGPDGRPRVVNPAPLFLRWDRGAWLPGLGRPVPGAPPARLVVAPIGPLHGTLVSAPEGLGVSPGDIVAWDRSMGTWGEDGPQFPLVARLGGRT